MKISLKSVLQSLFLTSLPVVSARWKPTAGTKWNWSLGENPNNIVIPSGEYEVIDIDLFDTTEETIKKFHDQGLKVICYFSAGTYEPFRAESQGMLDVPGLVQTKMADWDENWLDVRIDGLKPFMIERLDLAVYKGCDGVEFDNVDAFQNTSWNNPLTADDQFVFNRWLAEEAHYRNLAAGLKNCLSLANRLVDYFDFAINESCSSYSECYYYNEFLKQDKAVFTALYGLITDPTFVGKICNQIKVMPQGLDLSIIIKDPDQSLKYPYIRFDYYKYCEAPPASTTTTTTITSDGGQCGDGYGICPSGQCCSKYGWCGKSDSYCGVSCQPAYGICY